MAYFKFLARTLVFGLLIIGASSCNPREETIVIISVVDINDVPVPGAVVKLFADPNFPVRPPIRLDMEGVTDALGQARFDYTEFYQQGQSGFAVLDVTAEANGLTAMDIIKILEEETTEKKLFLE